MHAVKLSYKCQNHCLSDHLQITPSIAMLEENGSHCSKIICYNCVHKIACYIFGVLQNVFLQLISYSSDVSWPIPRRRVENRYMYLLLPLPRPTTSGKEVKEVKVKTVYNSWLHLNTLVQDQANLMHSV